MLRLGSHAPRILTGLHALMGIRAWTGSGHTRITRRRSCAIRAWSGSGHTGIMQRRGRAIRAWTGSGHVRIVQRQSRAIRAWTGTGRMRIAKRRSDAIGTTRTVNNRVTVFERRMPMSPWGRSGYATSTRRIDDLGSGSGRPTRHARCGCKQCYIVYRLIVAVIPVHGVITVISINRHAVCVVFLDRIISGGNLNSGTRQRTPISTRGESQNSHRHERRI